MFSRVRPKGIFESPAFYNGTAKQPERQEYRLSDLFSRAEENPELELRVTVININPGYSENLLKSILAEFFRENREEVVEMSIWEFDQELHDKTLLEDGEAIGLEKGTLKAIKNIMSTLKLTAEQAMTALRIPETDKRKYADRL